MIAVPLPVAASAAQSTHPIQENMMKRRFYRTTSEESVVRFPLDNHPDVLKELVWEAGHPRWVLFGTPASGAGVLACMAMGLSVITLCEDAHHQNILASR